MDLSDLNNCAISYLRKGSSHYLLCVHNFTPNYVPSYFIRLKNAASVREVFNTDREEYWGSGKINREVSIEQAGVQIQLAPLATLIFEVKFA